MSTSQPAAPPSRGRRTRERLVGDAEAVRHQRIRTDNQVRGATKNVTRGQALGRVPPHIDAELCGALLMGGVSQALHSALRRRRKLPRERVIGELQRFMQRVLCIQDRG
ncbi:MAG: hypothetical protein KC766_40500 [Myxococcales bacterium]|nr:hypothetical protein [Myxococcales bacterium]